MSHLSNKIDALGRREATTVAAGTVQRAFATLGTTDPPRRQAISLNNLDASAEIYVTLAPTGASAPGVSTTDNDVVVPPRSSRQFRSAPASTFGSVRPARWRWRTPRWS